MLSKLSNVTWPNSTFVESIKGWQSVWFYITEPRDPKWAAAPEFRSGIPTRLTSWKESSLIWGDSEELTGLQTRIRSMVNKNVKLVNVIQVMLFCRILPCQSRTCHLWEFDPAEHQTLQQFFGTTHEDIWKVLFKANETWLETTEDRGYNLAHPASSVSFSYSKVRPSPVPPMSMSKLPLSVFSGLDK